MTLIELRDRLNELIAENENDGGGTETASVADQDVMVVLHRIAGLRPFYHPIKSVGHGPYGLGIFEVAIDSVDRRKIVPTLSEPKAY